VFIAEVGAFLQVGSDLGLDGLGQQLRGSVAKDLGEDVLVIGQWQSIGIRGSFVHGGVLQCLVGMGVGSSTPRVRRLFQAFIHNFRS
jgi:hypothetical protein